MTKRAFDKIKEGLDEALVVAPYAAEIERLREENERLREALSYYAEENYNGYNGSGACARAAIREGGRDEN